MSGTDTWALPYRRLPLERSKKEVRLIEFHFEGGGDDFFTKAIDMDEEAKRPISLRMVKASLLEPPKFRALSYVWGPSKEGRRITLQVPKKVDLKGKSTETTASAEEEELESCEIDVTDNLFSALVHYRTMSSEDKPAYFWIDALCINQRDNDEKSWQVAMMRDVYKSAHLVMAWLGSYPEPVTFRPGELIKTFAALARDGLSRFGYPVCLPLSVVRTASDVRFVETDIVEWVRDVKVVPGAFSRANPDGTYEISESALRLSKCWPFGGACGFSRRSCLPTRSFSRGLCGPSRQESSSPRCALSQRRCKWPAVVARCRTHKASATRCPLRNHGFARPIHKSSL